MKVAVAADGPAVAAHFGRCESYVIADVDDGTVGEQERIPNPGHEPGKLPALLHGLGVECIIAGGMGPRAVGLFTDYGIQAVVGIQASVVDALQQLAAGTLVGGPSTCDH